MGGHKNYIKVFDLGKPVDSKGYQIARGVNHIHSGVDHPDVVALEVRLLQVLFHAPKVLPGE
jgi:hypothetical protein